MVEFNKMFVMLPVMFLARKLDAEDPNIVFYLRVAYACMQFISILVVMYTYIQASAVKGDQIVYVPAAATVRMRLEKADEDERCKITIMDDLTDRISLLSLSFLFVPFPLCRLSLSAV
jgi:hypothetical protein